MVFMVFFKGSLIFHIKTLKMLFEIFKKLKNSPPLNFDDSDDEINFKGFF